jgi:hypothetical protein
MARGRQARPLALPLPAPAHACGERVHAPRSVDAPWAGLGLQNRPNTSVLSHSKLLGVPFALRGGARPAPSRSVSQPQRMLAARQRAPKPSESISFKPFWAPKHAICMVRGRQARPLALLFPAPAHACGCRGGARPAPSGSPSQPQRMPAAAEGAPGMSSTRMSRGRQVRPLGLSFFNSKVHCHGPWTPLEAAWGSKTGRKRRF